MIGGLMGDYAGSRYEHIDLKGYNLSLSGPGHRTTDDTILMTATMDALMNNLPFADAYRKWFHRYPDEGYSPSFAFWATYEDERPYQSEGNGAAVRATPIGFFGKTEDQVLELAKQSAICTHDTEEAIKGAQICALAVFLARTQKGTCHLRLMERFGIETHFDLDQLFQSYNPNFICTETVPQAVFIGMKSKGFEDSMRKGTYIGGDTDTQMAIAGAIAQARGKPLHRRLLCHTVKHLNDSGMSDVLHLVMEFESRCKIHYSIRETQELTRKYGH
jgi:ADP-ribosylglycohydrolase